MRPQVLLAAALLTAACQGPAPSPAPVQSGASPEELRARADAHFAEKNYDQAVAAYRDALAADERNLAVRHRLAVALAQLGRGDEAAEVFHAVIAQAPPGSDEARIARQWIAERESPAQPVGATTLSPSTGAETGGTARVEGRTEWAHLDPSRARPNLQLLLQGDEVGTQGRRYWSRTLLGEPYRFDNVAPGRYRLIAQVGSVRLWDTSVTVAGPGTIEVDLTTQKSPAKPDALRPRS